MISVRDPKGGGSQIDSHPLPSPQVETGGKIVQLDKIKLINLPKNKRTQIWLFSSNITKFPLIMSDIFDLIHKMAC